MKKFEVILGNTKKYHYVVDKTKITILYKKQVQNYFLYPKNNHVMPKNILKTLLKKTKRASKNSVSAIVKKQKIVGYYSFNQKAIRIKEIKEFPEKFKFLTQIESFFKDNTNTVLQFSDIHKKNSNLSENEMLKQISELTEDKLQIFYKLTPRADLEIPESEWDTDLNKLLNCTKLSQEMDLLKMIQIGFKYPY